METKVISFANLPKDDNGAFLPKPLAGIYAMNKEEKIEFYLVTVKKDGGYHSLNKERDIIRIERIGENVDLRYLLLEPTPFCNLLQVDVYPHTVDDYDTRRSEEDIRKNMGYETGLTWVSGASILNKNFLGFIESTEIIAIKKSFGFLGRKSKWIYIVRKENFPIEIKEVLKFHNIQVSLHD